MGRRHYPHPYARMGCLGPSVGCTGCLIVLAAAAALLGTIIGVFA